LAKKRDIQDTAATDEKVMHYKKDIQDQYSDSKELLDLDAHVDPRGRPLRARAPEPPGPADEEDEGDEEGDEGAEEGGEGGDDMGEPTNPPGGSPRQLVPAEASLQVAFSSLLGRAAQGEADLATLYALADFAAARGLDPTVFNALPAALKKAPAFRGPLDALVIKSIDDELARGAGCCGAG